MTMFGKVCAATLGVAAICACWIVYQRSSVPGQTVSVASSVPTGTGGMMMHVDPRSGDTRQERDPSTPALTLSPQEQSAASTSGAGLVEKPAPGGGTTIDLQGRFQAPLVAKIGPDGKMTMQHQHDTPFKSAK